jgi:hypothetical protein
MRAAALILRHLGEISLFALSAWGWGSVLLRRLAFRDAFEGAVLAVAAGIGILGSLFHALGLAGSLTPAAVLLLLVLPAPGLLLRPTALARPDRPRRGVLLLVAALGLGPALWLALYPPTAFDATLYHLPAARAFAEIHAVPFLPTLRFPVFPQLMEILFAAALVVSDDITAQLVHFLCLAAGAALLCAWGRRLRSERAGLWAAAAFLGNPLVLSVGAAANVDVGIALFGGAAVFTWWLWREEGDERWILWSGVFAGFAASTKYTGLFMLAALPVFCLFSARGHGGLRAAAKLLGTAALVALPFYARIVAETGNPLFPYFARWFGPNAWSQPYDPMGSEGPLSKTIVSTRVRLLDEPMRLAKIPIKLVTPGGGFGKETIYSPWNLLLAPLLIWPGLADRRLRPLVLLSLAYCFVWYVAIPDRRYLFLVVPALTVVAAAGLDRIVRWQKTGPVTAAIFLVLVSPGLLWTGRATWKRGPLPATPKEREAYLARAVPVSAALASLNASLGSRQTVYGLYCENAAYFCRGRFLGDHFGPYRYSLVTPALGDARALHGVLRTLGATHLVTTLPVSRLPIRSPESRVLFRELPAPPGVRLYALAPEPPISSPAEPNPN